MPASPILEKMLERLYATLVRGPSLNCRPRSSRQRADLAALERLRDRTPSDVLRALLEGDRPCRVAGRVPAPEVPPAAPDEPPPPETPEMRAWKRQKSLLTRLRNLGADALTYEQHTGVHALHVGYPLLSLPPGLRGTGRVLAPVAFVPVTLEVNASRRPGVALARKESGVDLVVPNAALLAWLERETRGAPLDDLFADEEGEEPWREIRELIECVAGRLELAVDAAALTDPAHVALAPVPRAEDLPREATVLSSAVVGLFPAANQGLLRDTRWMIEAPALSGPVESFLDVDVGLVQDAPAPAGPVEAPPRRFADERFVARADPYQSRAVAHARATTGLVIHGPPGTGKSQTITNIIGDHLARGQRVLFVSDKRTALDVVANRLEHIGVGRLCAVVHDPRRDQRSLYMSIRGSLETLPEAETDDRADAKLARVDTELQAVHDGLAGRHAAFMRGEPSFHDLCGEWLTIDAPSLDVPALADARREELDAAEPELRVVLDRALTAGVARNPWRHAAGASLDAFLGRPVDEMRRGLASCVEDARVADRHAADSIPPFSPGRALAKAADARDALAARLRAAGAADATVLERAAAMDPDAVAPQRRGLEKLAAERTALDEPLDRELALAAGDAPAPLLRLNRDIADLDRYRAVARKWWSLIAFGPRRAAARVLRDHGLPLDPDAADRVRRFAGGRRARVLLCDLAARLADAETTARLADDTLRATRAGFDDALGARALAEEAGLGPATRAALRDEAARTRLVDGLDRSRARAEALAALEESLERLALFDGDWRTEAARRFRAGGEAGPALRGLEEAFGGLEAVLRVRDALARMPTPLRAGAETAVAAGLDPDAGCAAVRRGVLAGALRRRARADPALGRLDAQRIEHDLKRYADLEARKRELVRASIVHRWIGKQRERLLAGTGTRLNSAGAGLRRRLFVRGKRALKLRQVIAAGQDAGDGLGDPLFDMCPVWMASPETVAQVFDRGPVFDVVIFDEASQCRLEEALPVLLRAKRAVIAGDPKQLPPTRFFEAAIVSSEEPAPESEQDLFEAQQGEVEDLLAGALNLHVEEAYLDVHYRSRNADLIGFSNENFYRSRLQALPGHPGRRARLAPVRLHRADGIYENRTNATEAERVAEIVDELLDRPDPPSVGVACFNIDQRDRILDALEARAEQGDGFAVRLATAQHRVGEGSFEGLFVRNLENVQGDERDVIVISTTYGPTPEGKFYRRFGPLGQAGGGRRLNVLVTRARAEVHVVTSIPRSAYATADSIPEGRVPNGTWLLFAYLRYAERLERVYAEAERELATAAARRLVERPIPPPSRFAFGLGRRLLDDLGIGSDVHWGNTGFCVDAALHHPDRADAVTLGVLCDFARYPGAPDPVEWEVFRTGILEWNGWDLHRVWTPRYFRDPHGTLEELANAAKRALKTR